jgi:hypothetical protein
MKKGKGGGGEKKKKKKKKKKNFFKIMQLQREKIKSNEGGCMRRNRGSDAKLRKTQFRHSWGFPF